MKSFAVFYEIPLLYGMEMKKNVNFKCNDWDKEIEAQHSIQRHIKQTGSAVLYFNIGRNTIAFSFRNESFIV